MLFMMRGIKTMELDKEAKKYYKNIKKLFPLNGKNEKIFLLNLQEQIKEFCEDKTVITYDELIEEFGTPIDIVITYYQSIDSDYILKKINTKKIVKICLILFVALCFILITWRCYLYYQSYQDYQNALPSYDEITIIEDVN